MAADASNGVSELPPPGKLAMLPLKKPDFGESVVPLGTPKVEPTFGTFFSCK